MTSKHRLEQEAFRAAKKARREAEAARLKAERRRIQRVEVFKEDMLTMLQAEGYAPLEATVILGTGHHPDKLVFDVGFNDAI
jgi:hypothetical protein